MTRKNLRLLSYIRVSDVRGREGAAFISPDEQREKCRSCASAFGHTIVDEGEELDRPGGDMTRPVFNALLERIESGEADGIIVAELNRFARSNVGAWQALERIKSAGGELLSVEENIDTSTATGRSLPDFWLIAANWERERIGEQWLSARTRAVGRGIHVSRHAPPGYKRLPKSNDSKTDRILVPHAKHAATIEEAFAMAARGESYTRIADYLTDRRLPIAGSGDSVWEANRVRRLLANRVYLGEARSGRGIANDRAHEPLVSEETFMRAQRSKPEPELTRQVNNLLAGLCRCASCSYAMRSQPARGETIAVYRCRTTSVNGRCPQPTTISQQRLEEYVVEAFLARHNTQLVSSDEPSEEESALVQAAIDAEASYRHALTNTELRNQIGSDDHDRMVGALHAAWQDALSKVPTPRRAPAIATSDLVELVGELRKRGDVLDLRELLASAIQAVFVRPAASRSHSLPIAERVRIVWADEPPLELPKRGNRFEPRAFTW
jgi:DNA invertase Pin-like site-specific DNA recombinase